MNDSDPDSDDSDADADADADAGRRQRGLEMMSKVYGWEVQDGPGDFFALTADHLFADIWTRPGLSMRDRRLLLLGALAAQGLDDVADIQVRAALGNGELDADQLREIGLFLLHYIGWPLGTKFVMKTEAIISQRERAQRKKERAERAASEKEASEKEASEEKAES
jgi:4-carboxymuconolactone decarboxylase